MRQIISILGLIYLFSIILLYIKGKVKWATFFSLITFSIYPLTLGLVFIYALPNKNIIHGKVIAELPIAIALSMIILSVFSLKATRIQPNTLQDNPSKIRWLMLFSGIVICYLGIVIALVFFYAPQSFGHSTPMPHYGVIANLICSLIGSIILYLASKKGSAKRPNLFRHISFLIIFLVFYQTTWLISLILVYAFPVKPSATYPTLASLNLICFLFYGILFILMRREYIEIDAK